MFAADVSVDQVNTWQFLGKICGMAQTAPNKPQIVLLQFASSQIRTPPPLISDEPFDIRHTLEQQIFLYQFPLMVVSLAKSVEAMAYR